MPNCTKTRYIIQQTGSKMTNLQINAPRRAQRTHAKIWHLLKSIRSDTVLRFLRIWRDPRQSYPRLTDRQALDIGLDAADLEWSRMTLPSQTTRHPML